MERKTFILIILLVAIATQTLVALKTACSFCRGRLRHSHVTLARNSKNLNRISVYLSFLFAVEDMEQYLHYIGGGAGALALTGVAAASAFYLASRPSPERPLFPLDAQCIIQPVSKPTKTRLASMMRFHLISKSNTQRERVNYCHRHRVNNLCSLAPLFLLVRFAVNRAKPSTFSPRCCSRPCCS